MNKNIRILLCAEEPGVSLLSAQLEERGFPCLKISTRTLPDHLEEFNPSLLLLDLQDQELLHPEVLQKVYAMKGNIPILLLVQPNNGKFMERAKEYEYKDFLFKPVDPTTLERKIQEVFNQTEYIVDARISREGETNDYSSLLCHSRKMKNILAIIDQVAETNITVLIRGESGTGKELVARTIFSRSLRREKPFVKVLCAALPEGLLESELFGYEKGAFTGAQKRKPGKFEFADGGTIFLDEIGEIHPSLQAKLLQVLQDGEFSRIGGENDVKVDTRVIAATNRNLEKAVSEGHFREDLFYRLNVVSIYLPPLRERKEEIPFLVDFFLKKFNKQYGKNYPGLSDRTYQLFMEHNWPGNVRELENTIKRVVVLGSEEDILKSFSHGSTNGSKTSSSKQDGFIPTALSPFSLKDVGKEAAKNAEKELLKNILNQTHWNRKKAAQLLNISYKALLYKLKKYDLSRIDELTLPK
jgi:two-component system response regulator AtoC